MAHQKADPVPLTISVSGIDPSGLGGEVYKVSEPESADWRKLKRRCKEDPLLDARASEATRSLPSPDETPSDSNQILSRWRILCDASSSSDARVRLVENLTHDFANPPSLRQSLQSYLILRRLLGSRIPLTDPARASIERILDWASLEECTWLEGEMMPAEFVESVLHAIHHLHRDPSTQTLFQEFCEIAVTRMKLPLAWIALRSAGDEPETLSVPGHAGAAAAYLDSLKVNLRPDEPEGRGPVAQAIRMGSIQTIRRTSEDERFRPWRERAGRFGLASMAALPIRVRASVVGALAVYSREESFFTDTRIRILSELAVALGLKLEEHTRNESSHRLLRFYRATHAINELITRHRPFEEILAETCRLTVEETGLRLAYIVRIDPTRNKPDILHASGPAQAFLDGIAFGLVPDQLDSGISALVTATCAPVLVNRIREDPRFTQWYPRLRAHELASAAAFPLWHKAGSLWGIMVFIAAEPDFFDPGLVEHLESITRSLSLVIEDQIRETKLLRMERFYSVLAQISEFLATDPPATPLIQKACDLACAAADLPVAYITLIDPHDQKVHIEAFSGPASDHIQQVPITIDPGQPEGCGITGTVYRTRQPRIIDLNDPDSAGSVWLSEPERRTLAAIAGFPLLVGERCQGVLGLGASSAGFFDAELCELLERIVECLSIGLARNQEKRERIRFENLYHALAGVYRLVARNPKPELLYRELCENLSQLNEIDGIGIFQIPEQKAGAPSDESPAIEIIRAPGADPALNNDLPDFCDELAKMAARAHEPVFAGSAGAPSLPETLDTALKRVNLKEAGAFPVLHRGRIPAVLVITSREAGYFKPEATTRLCLQVCEAMTLALTEYEREEALKLMAFTDSLTRLPNRNLFFDRLDGALKQAERTQAIVGVGILDIDHFKEINDRFGHDAGDVILATTAARLEAILNRESTAARLAGDEFGLILSGLNTETEITGVLEHLRTDLAQPIRYRDYLLPVTVSLGVTLYPQDPVSARILLRHADLALYRAKARGRNAWAFFEEDFEHLLESRIELHNRLKTALQSGAIQTHLQPIVDLTTGRIVGAEAFARWADDPEQRLDSAEWLAAIEDDPPLLLETGRRLFRALGRELQQLDSENITIPLSLNVNLRYLLSPHFAEDIRNWIQDYGAYANRLVFELKPSTLLSDWNRLPDILEDIRMRGVSIALDNFGTWPVSLRNLQHLHSRGIKIDRSFLINLLTDPRAASLTGGALRSGEVGGYDVTGVGIETPEIVEMYLALGGRLAQGFALAPAMPHDTFIQWMRTWKPQAACETFPARSSHAESLPLLLSKVHHRWCQRVIEQSARIPAAKQKTLFSSLRHYSCPLIPGNRIPFDEELSAQHDALHALLERIIDSFMQGNPDAGRHKAFATSVEAFERQVQERLERLRTLHS